jgi:hypothetical protein
MQESDDVVATLWRLLLLLKERLEIFIFLPSRVLDWKSPMCALCRITDQM